MGKRKQRIGHKKPLMPLNVINNLTANLKSRWKDNGQALCSAICSETQYIFFFKKKPERVLKNWDPLLILSQKMRLGTYWMAFIVNLGFTRQQSLSSQLIHMNFRQMNRFFHLVQPLRQTIFHTCFNYRLRLTRVNCLYCRSGSTADAIQVTCCSRNRAHVQNGKLRGKRKV